MGDESDGDELTENVTYRLAYGEAHRIAASRDRSFVSSRDRVRDVVQRALPDGAGGAVVRYKNVLT